jgi:hypothetical protein
VLRQCAPRYAGRTIGERVPSTSRRGGSAREVAVKCSCCRI